MNSATTSSSSGSTWRELPPALQLHILSLLPLNDRALSGRLGCRDMRDALADPQHCTACLTQPLPPHAVPWAVAAGQQHVQQLPLRRKVQLLCTATTSGSEANLEVALALLQPSLLPRTLCPRNERLSRWCQCPGTLAVQAGHPQLLGWLLCHCPGLLYLRGVLMAAVEHCDLAGLQAVWEVLRRHRTTNTNTNTTAGSSGDSNDRPALDQDVLNAAAGSCTPDAVAKMEWLLAAEGGRCRLQEGTFDAALSANDLARLDWLLDHDCPVDGRFVLETALEHADLAVVQWLCEAGCELPDADRHGWWSHMLDAVKGPDGVAKLEWLQEQGGPCLRDASDGSVASLVQGAAEEGQVEVVRYLLPGLWRAGLVQRDPKCFVDAAIESGCVQIAELVRQAGAVFGPTVDCNWFTLRDNLPFIRWLIGEAGVSTVRVTQLPGVILYWPSRTAANSRDLLEAVQLLLDKAGCLNWTTGDAEVRYDDDGVAHVTQVLYATAERGDLALLQYLLQALEPLGCQLDGGILDSAAKGGSRPVMEWLVAEQPGCLEGACPYVFAAANGDLASLTALQQLGVPWGAHDVVARAVQQGCGVSAVHWLVGHGAPVGSECSMGRALVERDRACRLPCETAAWLRGLAAGAAGGCGAGRG